MQMRWLLTLTFTGLLTLPARAPAGEPLCTGDLDGDRQVTVAELVTSVGVALARRSVFDALAADPNGDGSVTVSELIRAVGNALDGCPADREAFVIATDFETGSFATIDLETRSIVPAAPERMLGSDPVVRRFGERLYVLNRFLGDNVQILDPAADYATVAQCSTGAGTNPHDIVVVGPERAFVSLYEVGEILVVDPTPAENCDGFILDRFDLTAIADADGVPELDQMALVAGRLYVVAQRLDRDNFFAPAGPGAVAVVDPDTGELLQTIELAAGNPFAATKGLTLDGASLVIAQVGSFGVLDGGIERIDLRTGTSSGLLITEEALGGDILDFVLGDDGTGWAVVSNADFTNDLVRFDAASGEVIDRPIRGAGFLADIEANTRGELYVADRSPERPGVRVFKIFDGTEATPAPLDTGLPPAEIVFVR